MTAERSRPSCIMILGPQRDVRQHVRIILYERESHKVFYISSHHNVVPLIFFILAYSTTRDRAIFQSRRIAKSPRSRHLWWLILSELPAARIFDLFLSGSLPLDSSFGLSLAIANSKTEFWQFKKTPMLHSMQLRSCVQGLSAALERLSHTTTSLHLFSYRLRVSSAT